MQHHPTLTQDGTGTNAADDAHYTAILRDLVDRGAALARQIHERAQTSPSPNDDRPEPDPTIAFDRIARAVRRCIVLARHIAAHPTPAMPGQTCIATCSAACTAARTTARARLIRGVEDAIHRKAATEGSVTQGRAGRDSANERADERANELNERLEDPELDLDLETRPIQDIIDELCRDLGVAMQGPAYTWKRRTPAEIAALRTRAATPTAQPPPEKSATGLSAPHPTGLRAEP